MYVVTILCRMVLKRIKQCKEREHSKKQTNVQIQYVYYNSSFDMVVYEGEREQMAKGATEHKSAGNRKKKFKTMWKTWQKRLQ